MLKVSSSGTKVVGESAQLRRRAILLTGVSALVLGPVAAWGATFETNIPELTIEWSNTIAENVLVRTENPSKVLLSSPNNDDTDRNMPHGLAAARTDLTSQLDIKYQDYGIRGSAFAWVDAAYLHRNNNNSPGTLNSQLTSNQIYSPQAKNLAGYKVELGDLFTYGSVDLGNAQRVTYRLGQFAQLWGESLYLATNGISYGMNPIDGIKGQLLLNPQARDVYMATPQVSFTYQPTAPLSFGFYYKAGFRPTRVAPVGTYFSSTDTLDAGGDKIYAPVGPGTLGYLRRQGDIKPNGLDGQFGVQVRYNFGDFSLGLYALRYDETTPQIVYPHPLSPAQIGGGFVNYLIPRLSSGASLQNIQQQYFASNAIGTYQVVYPKGVQLYGTSFSGNVFDVINIGAEVSARHNTDLVSIIQSASPFASNSNNAAYAVGDTLHGQISAIYASPPVPMIGADQVLVTGEVGFNELLHVSQNKQALAPNVDHFASLGELVVSAAYYSIQPGLDMTPSVGVSGQLVGTSAVDSSERAHTGNVTAGLLFVYNQRYNFQAQYRHYIGAHSNVDPTQNNLLLGRDFVGFTFSTTL